MSSDEFDNLQGSISSPDACPYFDGRVWENLLVETGVHLSPELHEQLLDRGFRRMGTMFFQPICQGCNECRSMRVATATFRPGKSLRRARNKNADLVIEIAEPSYSEEKRALLELYLESRHAGPMVADEDGVRNFMFQGTWCSKEMTYFLDGRLVAVGLVDVLPNILSSLYFFFDPVLAKRSIGIASMMFELDWAKSLGCTWYHPGFFIRGCPAMSYKARFGPAEILSDDGSWRSLVAD